MTRLTSDIEPGVSKTWFNRQWDPSPKMGILKHLSGLTLVHYRELVCLEERIVVDSGFAVVHYSSSEHTNKHLLDEPESIIEN